MRRTRSSSTGIVAHDDQGPQVLLMVVRCGCHAGVGRQSRRQEIAPVMRRSSEASSRAKTKVPRCFLFSATSQRTVTRCRACASFACSHTGGQQRAHLTAEQPVVTATSRCCFFVPEPTSQSVATLHLRLAAWPHLPCIGRDGWMGWNRSIAALVWC